MTRLARTYWRDSRDAVRGCLRRPRLAVLWMVTLAVLAGAGLLVSSAILAASILSAPYQEPATLVQVVDFTDRRCVPGCVDLVRGVEFKAWRDRARSLESVTATRQMQLARASADGGEVVRVAEVDSAFFDTFGVAPFRGRVMSGVDFAHGASEVAVLRFDFWQRAFGGREVTGTSIVLGARTVTIIGVMPRGFEVPARAEAWMAGRTVSSSADTLRALNVYARLSGGASAMKAAAEVAAIGLSVATSARDQAPASVLPINWEVRGARNDGWLALIVVAGFTLVALSNLAAFVLARSIGRQREVAIRAALGAASSDLRRVLLLEGAIVGTAAAAIGLWAAVSLRGLVAQILRDDIGTALDLRLPIPLVLVVCSLTVVLSVLISLVAARAGGNAAHAEMLRSGGVSTGRQAGSMRRWLVGAQVAVTVGLVSASATLASVLVSIDHFDVGYDAERLIGGRVRFTAAGLGVEAADPRMTSLREAALAEPGVLDATVLAETYPRNALSLSERMRPTGSDQPLPISLVPPYAYLVDGRFFSTVGLEAVRGRLFAIADATGVEQVAIINETAATAWFPAIEAIGQRIDVPTGLGGREPLLIIGVVRDTHVFGEASIAGGMQNPGFFPLIFRPQRQAGASPASSARILIRTELPANEAIAARLARILAGVGEAKVTQLSALRNEMSSFGALAAASIRARVLIGVAIAACAMALFGVCGLVLDSAARRTREIGIRLALGESPLGAVLLIAREAMRSCSVGVVVGLGGAMGIEGFLRRFLQPLGLTVDQTYSLVAVLIVVGALALSALLAARTAGSVSPTTAMRTE